MPLEDNDNDNDDDDAAVEVKKIATMIEKITKRCR